ncbi:hypothetical protein CDAR_614921 [Caerostris darwini]|uniref:Uncharacterized protein n=1 Tax=Caerostris darwini TaxID=1538125 RepID=A0AAV4RLQ5_9ARAC|nr:hypothetical protein CDAR_614921 [Caerostris darwini]
MNCFTNLIPHNAKERHTHTRSRRFFFLPSPPPSPRILNQNDKPSIYTWSAHTYIFLSFPFDSHLFFLLASSSLRSTEPHAARKCGLSLAQLPPRYLRPTRHA